MPDPTCPTCGQHHPRCAAHSKQHGGPCGQRPVPGSTICRFHGGNAKQVKARADQRLQEQAAAAEVAKLGARRDVHPAEALLDLVHWTAGEVDYWRARVQQLEEDELTWGKAQHRKGRGPEGPINVKTHEARPHVAYVMLERASDRLAQYAAAALKAGVDERRVRLAEQTGALVADVIRRILADLNLTEAQQLLVGEVVPRHLRAIAAAGGGDRA